MTLQLENLERLHATPAPRYASMYEAASREAMPSLLRIVKAAQRYVESCDDLLLGKVNETAFAESWEELCIALEAAFGGPT